MDMLVMCELLYAYFVVESFINLLCNGIVANRRQVRNNLKVSITYVHFFSLIFNFLKLKSSCI